jgi:hypothetical protein
MTSANKSQMSSAGGCGCGKANGASGCGGCSACGGACSTAGLVRPRFFAGQLLTEDDLSALGDYVTAKSRLHNRALFGAGVVNGLSVSCHPCDASKVIVGSGYALDCCGHDLVVPATQELDVKALVQKLALSKNGGVNCDDPCPQPLKAGDPPSPKDPSRRLFLYAVYCETETDPVSPYATDASCADRGCEPTRVREGVRFELRCTSTPAREDVLSRFTACIGDLVGSEKSTTEAAVLQQSANDVRGALDPDAAQPFRREDGDRFGNEDGTPGLISALRDALGALPNPQDPATPTEKAVLDAVDLVRQLAGLVTLFNALAADDPLRDTFRNAAARASEVLTSADSVLTIDLFQKVIVSALMRDVALATMALSAKYARFSLIDNNNIEDAGANNPDRPPSAVSPKTIEAQLFARGGVFTATLQSRFAEALDALRGDLYQRLGRRTSSYDCRLRQDVQAILMLAPAVATDVTRSDAQLFVNSTYSVLGAVLRFALDCACASVNPPEPSCEDPAVLLACLTVQRCDVLEVCNLQRTYVITGPSIRHWLPPIGWLGTLVEGLCCELPDQISALMKSQQRDSSAARLLVDAILARDGGPGSSGRRLDLLNRALASYYASTGVTSPDLYRIEQIALLFGAIAAGYATQRGDSRTRLQNVSLPGPDPLPDPEVEALITRISNDPSAARRLADALAKATRPQ